MDKDLWTLVKENQGLIGYMIQRFLNQRSMEPATEAELRDELDGVGLEALHKAATTWDPAKGTFPTYARAIMWRDFVDAAHLLQVQRGEAPKTGDESRPVASVDRLTDLGVQLEELLINTGLDPVSSDVRVDPLAWMLAADLSLDERQIVQAIALDGRAMLSVAEDWGHSRTWVQARLDSGRKKMQEFLEACLGEVPGV